MVLNKAHVEPEAKPNQRKPAPGQSNQFLVVFRNGNIHKHPNTHVFVQSCSVYKFSTWYYIKLKNMLNKGNIKEFKKQVFNTNKSVMPNFILNCNKLF